MEPGRCVEAGLDVAKAGGEPEARPGARVVEIEIERLTVVADEHWLVRMWQRVPGRLEASHRRAVKRFPERRRLDTFGQVPESCSRAAVRSADVDDPVQDRKSTRLNSSYLV